MKKNVKYDVTALGEILIDFADVGRTDENYPIMAANAGGAPANFLSVLAKYGKKTAFIGKVGNDVFGNLLVETVRHAGIDTTGVIVDDDHFTTLAFVTLDENGDREFSFSRKPGADTCITEREVPTDIIDESAVFHFGTLSLTDEPSKSALEFAVDYAIGEGCLITFDPNLRRPLWRSLDEAKKAIEWGLGKADVVKISDEETEFLWEDINYTDAANRLINDYDVSLAMITLGKNGAYVANKNGRVYVPTPPARTIDTTGAGDIFGGSAVSCLLSFGKHPSELSVDELTEIAVFASAAASISTEKRGGIPSIPEYDAVLAYISSQK